MTLALAVHYLHAAFLTDNYIGALSKHVVSKALSEVKMAILVKTYLGMIRVCCSLVPRLLVGRETKNLILLFAHARNYPLLNMCLGNSGMGRNTIHVIDTVVIPELVTQT